MGAVGKGQVVLRMARGASLIGLVVQRSTGGSVFVQAVRPILEGVLLPRGEEWKDGWVRGRDRWGVCAVPRRRCHRQVQRRVDRVSAGERRAVRKGRGHGHRNGDRYQWWYGRSRPWRDLPGPRDD